MTLEDRTYPNGRFSYPDQLTVEERNELISILEKFPLRLGKTSEIITGDQLNQSYREGGWNARQIFHHLADSHVNMYIRLKLTLTEQEVTINPYDENKWAAMEDGSKADHAISVRIIEPLHQRIVITLRSMSDADFERTYYHPGYKTTVKLFQMLALYAWHAEHHLGQIHVVTGGHGVKSA